MMIMLPFNVFGKNAVWLVPLLHIQFTIDVKIIIRMVRTSLTETRQRCILC